MGEEKLKEELERLKAENQNLDKQQLEARKEMNDQFLAILAEISNSLNEIKASMKDDSPRKHLQEER